MQKTIIMEGGGGKFDLLKDMKKKDGKGMIPMPDAERKEFHSNVKNLKPLKK